MCGPPANWAGSTIGYDANGNMAGDGVHTYTWNARNQLSMIDSGNTASFGYDTYGRRISKTATGQATGFLYNVANTTQELNGGTPTANILNGGTDEFFQRADASATTVPLTDALGSVLALANTSGALQTNYTYDPFGGTTVAGTASTNPTQYTGRENDGTGLYYYRARYYSPQFGRFISEDPAGFRGGINLYSYAYGNPVLFRDPFGLCPPTRGERFWLAGRGLFNLGVGVAKVGGGVAAVGETGGLAIGLGVYAIESGLVGNIGTGISQIAGAINGDSAGAERGAQAAAAGSTVSGLVTLALTRGNLEDAAAAAQTEGNILAPATVAVGEPVKPADALDYVQNVYDFLNPGKKPDMASPKCAHNCAE